MPFALLLTLLVLGSAAVLLYQYWTGSHLGADTAERDAEPTPTPLHASTGARIDSAA